MGLGGVNAFSFSDSRFLVCSLVYFLSKGGVSLFWFISAWYVKENIIYGKKIRSLYIKVWCYSVILFLFSIFFLKYEPDGFNIVRTIFPVLSKRYWFITAYFAFYYLSVYLKKLANQLNNSELCLLVILVKCYCIFVGDYIVMDCLASALVVFLVKRFWPKICKISNIHFYLGYVCFMMIGALCDFAVYRFPLLNSNRMLGIQELFYMTGALSLFCLFVKSDWNFRAIGTLCSNTSKNVVAIYLISVHPVFDKYLYQYIALHMPVCFIEFIVYFSFWTLGIGIICIIIDKIFELIICKMRMFVYCKIIN